jgi:hypothetical protein
MIKTQIHKGILIMIFMILAVANATAQNPYVLFEGSTQTYKVDLHGTNSYAWAVYNIGDYNNVITNDNSVYEVIAGENTNEISIKWKVGGDYALVVDESDGSCQNLKALRVQVIAGSPQIAFNTIESDDCYDGVNELIIPVGILKNTTDALPEGNYEVTINYSVQIGAVITNYSKTFTYADVGIDGEVNLSVEGIVEELDKTKEYTIRINSAIDGFNTPFNIVPGKGTHTRTIHQLPQTGTMVQQ